MIGVQCQLMICRGHIALPCLLDEYVDSARQQKDLGIFRNSQQNIVIVNGIRPADVCYSLVWK